MGMGVARVREERIERAIIACKETENFIVGSTLFTCWVLKFMDPPGPLITVSEFAQNKSQAVDTTAQCVVFFKFTSFSLTRC